MASAKINQPLPLVLAGPILRRCTPSKVVFWFALSDKVDINLYSDLGENTGMNLIRPEFLETKHWPIGEHAHIIGLVWSPEQPLIQGVNIHYNFIFNIDGADHHLLELIDDLNYEPHEFPHFVVDLNIKEVVHGSCRKPHHPSPDALVQLDTELFERIEQQKERPNYLMMSGDQVYTDDIAGPMLHAIHQVVTQLGLFNEIIMGAAITDSNELLTHPDSFYRRDRLLPNEQSNEKLRDYFWEAKRKPIFTTTNGDNHLISFAEVMAMYLLTWSPTLWSLVELDKKTLPSEFIERYQKQKKAIEEFAEGLSKVRRLMAHLPCYMIFDDHDVTDDWNLTREWEEASYGNHFSKRIIGNALLAYLLCQGWGNNPDGFEPLLNKLQLCFNGQQPIDADVFIQDLLHWHQWGYVLPTEPPTIVLDTRTQRWRSESNAKKPSGLMDWESLSNLQQELIDKEAVILVSPAPIYGVKLIETIQKIMTFFGLALTVDAENWMAHKGTANVILNIFRHKKTPPLFIILSGDVHYSFVYDVSLKFSDTQPHICQVTSSGIKNEFPATLLLLFDKLNRWLFHAYSPLNWLTRRRHMRIETRKPPGDTGRTLLNTSGIGLLKIDVKKDIIQTSILDAKGETHPFE